MSLHHSLFRRQKAQISRVVEGTSRAFREYQARYERATRTFEGAVSLAEVAAEVRRADVVYVGDYHTLRLAQRNYLQLVEAALAAARPVTLALEFVEGRHQAAVDAFLAGRISERTFLSRIGHLAGGFDLWVGFRPIFELARARKLEVVAIDRKAAGSRSLERRDAYAAERVAGAARAQGRPRVLVLMGQFHVAPCHLPARVRAALGGDARHLVVYQNCEAVYWKLLRRRLAHRVEAVRIREGELCLMAASPVVCQQSFLDYLEAESGDEQLIEAGAASRFREMARLIGRLVGADVGRALAEVEVATVADVDFLGRLRRRGRFTRQELAQVRRQILSRESYYIPRAKMAYLATLSLNHAAEEAAHFVRHCCVGDALDEARRPSDAFYARCLEEALGFFGSRLVNPRRRCMGVAEWARAFEARRGEERQIAAFVLAHKAAEREAPGDAVKLLPLRKDRLFHAVSHGLGYLLGDALHRAFSDGELGRREVRALFHERFEDPRASYHALLRRVAG